MASDEPVALVAPIEYDSDSDSDNAGGTDLGAPFVSFAVKDRDGTKKRLRAAQLNVLRAFGAVEVVGMPGGDPGSGGPGGKKGSHRTFVVFEGVLSKHKDTAALYWAFRRAEKGDFRDETQPDFVPPTQAVPADEPSVSIVICPRFASAVVSLCIDVAGRRQTWPILPEAPATPDQLWHAMFAAALYYQQRYNVTLPVVMTSALTSVKNLDKMLLNHPQRNLPGSALPICAKPAVVFERKHLRLLVGNLGSALSYPGFDEYGVRAVINLSGSDNVCSSSSSGGNSDAASNSAPPRVVPCLTILIDDNPRSRIEEHFENCFAFILKAEADATAAASSAPASAGSPPLNSVLVHCQAGRSRSASICIAFMMQHCGMTLAEAFDQVQASRFILPNKGFCQALVTLEKKLRGKNTLVWKNDWDQLVAPGDKGGCRIS